MDKRRATATKQSRRPAADEEVLQLDRVYHDPLVPELVCRYPAEPIVVMHSKSPREVTVAHNGQLLRAAVRNGDLARLNANYLMIREGADKGLWLLIEPGDNLE